MAGLLGLGFGVMCSDRLLGSWFIHWLPGGLKTY